MTSKQIGFLGFVFLLICIFIGFFAMSKSEAAEVRCEVKLAACDKCLTGCETAIKELQDDAVKQAKEQESKLNSATKEVEMLTKQNKDMKEELANKPSRLTWFFIGAGVASLTFGVGAIVALVVL